MFALAHMALARLSETVDASIALSAFRILPKVSLQLTQGQFLDLSYENKNGLSEDDYWPMIAGKTAALLSACSELGALIAGCPPETVDAYREFGYKIGMAYQVYDDVLGIWGDAALVGKSTDSDLLEGKNSLPILYCIAHSEEFSARWKEGNIRVDEIPYLTDLMEKTGAKEYSLDMSNKLTNEALGILEQAKPRSPTKDTLTELAYLLINRQK
jgi:geranylgeranyl diphosphate synthase type I